MKIKPRRSGRKGWAVPTISDTSCRTDPLTPVLRLIPPHPTPPAVLVLTVLKAERGPGAGTVMWRRAPLSRQRCDLAKPPRQPTWLHAHFCTGSKDSFCSPPASRASLPVRSRLVRVAVAAPSGSAPVAPQPPGPSAVAARGAHRGAATSPGQEFAWGRDGDAAGTEGGVAARSKEPPRGARTSPRAPRGPLGRARRGEISGPLTSLADRCSPAARTRARAHAAPREVPARLDRACAAARAPAPGTGEAGRERAPEPGGSTRAASHRHDAATARPSAAPASLDAAGRAAGRRPRASTEEARSRAPRPLEDGGGE